MKLNSWVLSFGCVAMSAWAQAPAGECVPACRSGYLCNGGQCVSRCNPPCGAGTTCLENGECSSAPAYLPPSAVTVGPRVNRGWATGAGVMAAVSAGVIVGLTGLTIAINGSDAANYTAAVAILFTGVSIPIAAVGAGSGRWDPRITGSAPWRIVGWISFGLAMANAVVALGIGIAGATFPSYGIASLGALATLSALSHMADAFITAGQGRELIEEQRATAPPVRGLPLFSFTPNARGGVTTTVGLALVF
jgi:hypothetical protein